MGALGDPYITVPEMKAYSDIPGINNKFDAIIDSVIQSASEQIELKCDRQFNKAIDATSRVYTPKLPRVITVDDFWTTEGLIIEIDTNGDGSFSTVLVPSDYILEPLNGMVAGQPGWPFNRIRLRGSSVLFGGWQGLCDWYSSVRVTAKWGWATVPDNVKQATFLLANENFAAKGAPLGVAGSNAFGDIRVRQGFLWQDKIQKYMRSDLLVG